jgi:ComF family protein
MRPFLTQIKNAVLDTLFPISCLGCGEMDEWLCKKCAARVQLAESQVCLCCEKTVSPGGRLCPVCRNGFLGRNADPPLDALLVAASYASPLVARMVHLLKYRFVSELSRPLGQLIVAGYLKGNLPLPDLVMAVPLHQRRLRWRGFNQAELLCDHVSQNLTPGLDLPVENGILVRKKYTAPQMKIKNYQERKANIAGAFILSSFSAPTSSPLKNKTVLLIDDIATTGATLFECGKVLKSAGAKTVFAAVVARQVFSPPK